MVHWSTGCPPPRAVSLPAVLLEEPSHTPGGQGPSGRRRRCIRHRGISN